MLRTTNYNLKKPERTDNILIGDLNENADIVDEKLKENADAMATLSSEVTTHLADYSSYASSVDSNGIYTVVDYKRADTTLHMKSTLSGGTSPSYTIDTWKFYDALGTTIISTKIWTITYDASGKVISKVVA